MKFPKSNEHNSPEGTRENNTKEMKKDYKSPKMTELKVDSEKLMSVSGSGGGSVCTDELPP